MGRQDPTDDLDQVRGSVWMLTAALALIALAILLLVRPLLGARDGAGAHPQSAIAAASGATHAGDVRRPPTAPRDDARPARPVPHRDVAPPPRAAAPADADPAASDQDAPPDTSEEPSGIALFPPPGTNPPKPGLIVPDDFELPPGYVRHHQVTDDGTPLPPILMFHPDFDWVDATGRKIELPADHVVPPELAPPGMPLQRLEIPDTHVDLVEQPPPGAQFDPADPDR
jgi:hypothetical protein